MHTCTLNCMHACTHACTHMSLCMLECMHTCTLICLPAYMCTSMHWHPNVCTHAHMHAHTHTHARSTPCHSCQCMPTVDAISASVAEDSTAACAAKGLAAMTLASLATTLQAQLPLQCVFLYMHSNTWFHLVHVCTYAN